MTQRPRRLRGSAALRRLVREHRVHPAQLVLPLFVRENLKAAREISSMPGVKQHSLESLIDAARDAELAGCGSVMLFGIPEVRDASGDAACSDNSILVQGIRAIKKAGVDLPVIADLCLDEFTSHGHCGLLDSHGNVDNDATLVVYQRMAVVLAAAGADILGLSGMMDGQVSAVRTALDLAGFQNTLILAYSAKYASAFYGPFRDAVESALDGDRRTYQQDPANSREALREIDLDVAEGADILMVKPGAMYFDILAAARQRTHLPLASYLVSGEYAMVESAAELGRINRRAAILELITSAARAGADLVVTYWASEAASWLKEDK